jgi:hypothetical protein
MNLPLHLLVDLNNGQLIDPFLIGGDKSKYRQPTQDEKEKNPNCDSQDIWMKPFQCI